FCLDSPSRHSRNGALMFHCLANGFARGRLPELSVPLPTFCENGSAVWAENGNANRACVLQGREQFARVRLPEPSGGFARRQDGLAVRAERNAPHFLLVCNRGTKRLTRGPFPKSSLPGLVERIVTSCRDGFAVRADGHGND